MEHARNSNLPPSPVPADDAGTVGIDGALTDRQELFAQEWARTGNKAAAYRIVYQPPAKTVPGTIWSAASRLGANPNVARRHAELVQQAALQTVVSIHEALQWQLDIATADPNEIVSVAIRCCRHCYGYNHAYQWIDDIEYMKACIAAIDEGKAEAPTNEGGYGYLRAFEPVVNCPYCLGAGIHEIVIHDTTKLTGKARKLYKGAKQDRFGAVEVFTHDQKAAWEMVCRMLGAFNDKLDLDPNGAKNKGKSTKLPDGLSEQEAARAYLDMLGTATK